MDSKLKRPLVALGVVAAFALPAGAAAHGGGHGPKADHGSHGAKGSAFHGGKKGRALIVKGTVSAVGTGTIDVLVKSANHHGHALRGQTLTFDVSNARIVVRDVNGDGKRDLADVAVGDRVLVQSRIAKGATVDSSQPVVAKQVVDKGAKPADTSGGGTTDTGGTGDTGDTGDSGTPSTP